MIRVQDNNVNMINGIKVQLVSDDYGETVNTSRDIIDLLKEGCLDGISILSNMSSYETCARLLVDSVSDFKFIPRINVHLDLIEGVSLLDGSVLSWDWKRLFLLSLRIPVRDRNGRRMSYPEIYEKLTKEIRAQISRGRALTEKVYAKADSCGVGCMERGLCIDSHQHAHLIPIVWKALMRVVDEDSLEVSHIRTAHEPLWPFLKHIGLGFKPIGFVKNRILALLAPKAERYLKEHGIKPAYLWGLIMSGHMDMDRIEKILPDVLKKCARKGYDLELNIHPGRMLPGEITEEIPADSAESFYLSADREAEAATVRVFKERINKLNS